ncbi:ABC transporter ATP-binding protein [Chelatococcus reniformis]|uniref:ABC transporter ATP-binding protein n=1 Tax=Chelatococcus reniformis TaxID=1494448 RepID=A0A916U852_9HYPH|nr:ATP-binding cassette domain-containing protein [Chelatococcus reniformis]GGC61552.1 ABC transporter ATP-binding protein [Chelatococcus reniformis]
MLSVEELSAGYGDILVLRELSLAVARNESVAVIGPNGAGKSTLVRTLCGLTAARAGRIVKDGVAIERLAPHRRAATGIAAVLENRRLFGELSVKTNLDLAAREGDRRPAQARRFDHASLFELFPFMRERLGASIQLLSGGEQQMVAIARALLLQPDLLVLDEPSTGLAPKIVKGLVDVIARIRRQGVGILLVEQNVALATEAADRAYVMSLGRVTRAIPPEQWRGAQGDGEIAKAYLGA